MAEKKIEIRERNASNTGWDTIYPKTKADIVVTDDGGNVQTKLNTLNTNLGTLDSEVDALATEVDSLKSSVSDGKNKIATAITGKGVSTSGSDTFSKMATNINSIQVGVNTSDATAYAGDILTGHTAYARGSKISGTMANRGSQGTIVPSTSRKTFYSGYYNQFYVEGDGDLISSNIRSGKNIFGVNGNMQEGKKFAEGTAVVQYLSSNSKRVTVNNIGFKPVFVFLYFTGESLGLKYSGTWFAIGADPNSFAPFDGTPWGSYKYAYLEVNSGSTPHFYEYTDYNPSQSHLMWAKMSTNGFDMSVPLYVRHESSDYYTQGKVINWIAYE